jgi:heat shock protein HtpX
MKKVSTVALMFLVALGVSLTFSLLLVLLGLAPYLGERGLDYLGLLMFCLVFGFTGSGVSLFLSKWLVKRSLRIDVLDPVQAEGEMRWLCETVRRLSDQSGLSKVPEVGIYSSPELNAFATGRSRDDALVAVSTGLLSSMSRNEIEGVLAHEISHIENGDMLRIALMQGVINTLFVEMYFGFFGALVVKAYSRSREFRADRSGAALAGSSKMIAALEALRDRLSIPDRRKPWMAVFKISSTPRVFGRLLVTHPPLEARIEALKRGI